MRAQLARRVVALLSLSAAVAPAQTDALRPGARVRVSAPGVIAGPLTATVVARTADSLTVTADNHPPLSIALARVTALEISRGRSRSAGAARGVLWSLPVGVAAGFAAEAAQRRCTSCGSSENLAPFQAGVIVVALCGAGVGALVGRERWEAYSLEPAVGIAPRRDGATVGVRWAF